MSSWETQTSEIVYKTEWFEIHRNEFTNHNKKPGVYSFLKMPHPAVTVVAINGNNEILLQKNYRYPLNEYLWELPSGHSDGQDPLVAAQRELLEEAGLESSDWSSLGETRLACGVADIHHYLFLAKSVHNISDERDEDEEIIDQRFIPVSKVRDMILNNEIVDGDSLVALYRFLLTA